MEPSSYYPVFIGSLLLLPIGYFLMTFIVDEKALVEDKHKLAIGPFGRHRIGCYLALFPVLYFALGSAESFTEVASYLGAFLTLPLVLTNLPHRMATKWLCIMLLVPFITSKCWDSAYGLSHYQVSNLSERDELILWKKSISDLSKRNKKLDWIIANCNHSYRNETLILKINFSVWSWEHKEFIDLWVEFDEAIVENYTTWHKTQMTSWHGIRNLPF